MSRNKREGAYAGWCYGVHRRTHEQLKYILKEGPRWYWCSRKVKMQDKIAKRYQFNLFD